MLTISDPPVAVKIKEIKYLTSTLGIVFVEKPNFIDNVDPGNFFMVWTGEDEFPLAISHMEEGLLGFTVEIVGDGTKSLMQKMRGEKIGVRGPLSTGYSLETKLPTIIIAGGIGFAPLRLATEHLVLRGDEIILFVGARNKESLLLRKDYISSTILGSKNVSVHVSTDDGSEGFPGTVTEMVIEEMPKILSSNSFEVLRLISAGPEPMLKTILDFVQSKAFGNTTDVQFSLHERYMKCGIGICGSCTIDSPSAPRLCVEGPVLNYQQLCAIRDFGIYGLDSSGRKKKLC